MYQKDTAVALAQVQPRFFSLPTEAKKQPYVSQKTITRRISCQGIGVHSGAPVTLSLSPALPGSGLTFIRTDLGGKEIKANWQTVVDTRQCTTIGDHQGVTVSTVEHLMAALAARGIDNLLIEINGPELPIMDGSSSFFVRLLTDAGIKDQRIPRKVIRVLKSVSVEEEGRKVSLSPSPFYEIEVDFDFAGRTALKGQNLVFRPLRDDFTKDIAAARTFGLLEDAETLWARGLAKGASLDNTLVYEGTKVLNEEGTRYEDECVRHKILDVMGDLHLSGGLLLGKFYGIRPGHGLHHKLLQALFNDPKAWTFETQEPSLKSIAILH